MTKREKALQEKYLRKYKNVKATNKSPWAFKNSYRMVQLQLERNEDDMRVWGVSGVSRQRMVGQDGGLPSPVLEVQ